MLHCLGLRDRRAEGGLLRLWDEITITDRNLVDLSAFVQSMGKVSQLEQMQSLPRTELMAFVGIGRGPYAPSRITSDRTTEYPAVE